MALMRTIAQAVKRIGEEAVISFFNIHFVLDIRTLDYEGSCI
jgi:hypothetical protein